MKKTFFSHGKLMLSGEYLALKGATVFSLATRFGQKLEVIENESGFITWRSFDDSNNSWFSADFSFDNFEILKYSDAGKVNFIRSLLVEISALNPNFLTKSSGVEIKTELDFHQDWGLGSSSTLISNLANWAEVDPFVLLGNTLGGSGYDIAVAKSGGHVLYKNQPEIEIKSVDFNPSYAQSIFFVYLNKKQDSAKEVIRFNNENRKFSNEKSKISDISQKLSAANSLAEFEELIREHNRITSAVLNRKSAQDFFGDYNAGVVKFLGAWGGDFILATGHKNDMLYFMERGLTTIVPYADMIKE